MTIGVEIEELAKVYRTSGEDVRALDDISLSIAEGERVGILGENGAGKSTLLQVISGLASPSAGTCHVKGRVHAALSLGLGLREELTGRQNLYLEAEIQGFGKAVVDGYVEKMIEFAELGHFIDEPVRTYSTGMKSRLTFASLVFVDPEVLLIDETLSAGDQFFQKKAAQAVQDLCDRGKIVLIVSHGVRGLADMSTRCIWLHRGRIRQDGNPHEVAEAYLEYARARIEEQAMSDLHARRDDWSATGRHRISAISIESDASEPASIDPQAGARIVVDVDADTPLQAPILSISMERMDGIVAAENRFELSSGAEMAPGRFRFTADVDRFLLAPSYYVLHAELCDGERPAARRSIVFRTMSSLAYTGGSPLLYQPISVAARKL